MTTRSAMIACWSALFTATGFMPAQRSASRSASQSARSVLLRRRYGFTYCGGRRTTSKPRTSRWRAQKWELAQASMTTRHGTCVPQNRWNCGRESRLRCRMPPVGPARASSKTFLAKSTAIVTVDTVDSFRARFLVVLAITKIHPRTGGVHPISWGRSSLLAPSARAPSVSGPSRLRTDRGCGALPARGASAAARHPLSRCAAAGSNRHSRPAASPRC
jgi:hypothetical protein